MGGLAFVAACLPVSVPAFAACDDPAKPLVDWTGCDKQKNNLKGANLIGALLGEANLKGADLEGADLEAADFGRANLRGARPHANLREASLGGANLAEADLRGANLESADLEGADLRGANLKGAAGEETSFGGPTSEMPLGSMEGFVDRTRLVDAPCNDTQSRSECASPDSFLVLCTKCGGHM